MDGVPAVNRELRYLILNSNEPLVFKNFLKWDMISWSLQDWSQLLANRELTFRCGKYAATKEPQWERTNSTKVKTFKEFLDLPATSGEWMYFDYKYLNECFKDIPILRNDIKWDQLGFPEVTADESALWVGSKGAHTPCHVDSYGCNLIAQIHGKKLWLVFPPEEDLKPSRVPYEESSIYSKLNFFSPCQLNDFAGIEKCKKIILEPGDVLFLPHKWWHYVENLGTAISINTWVPLPTDDKERLSEALVQFFVFQSVKNFPSGTRSTILNPNTDKDVLTTDAKTSLRLVKMFVDKCEDSNKNLKGSPSNKSPMKEIVIKDVLRKHSFIRQFAAMPTEDFMNFLRQQIVRFGDGNRSFPSLTESDDLIRLFNAFTDPEVVALIRDKILNL